MAKGSKAQEGVGGWGVKEAAAEGAMLCHAAVTKDVLKQQGGWQSRIGIGGGGGGSK